MGMVDGLSVALEWLSTDDARRAAAYEVASRSLPVALVDDLLGIVALGVAQHFATAAVAIDDPVAYARRALALRAVDLLRGQIRERLHRQEWPVDADDHDIELTDPTVVAGGDDAEVADTVARLRRAVHPLIAGPRPWAGAAALTVLTLTVHRDVALPPDVPRPEAGSDGQAVRWAALYLAGVRDCFPPAGAADDDAMRKRRSRAAKAVEQALITAAAACGVEVHDG